MRKESLEFLVNSYCVMPSFSRSAIVNDLFAAGVQINWIEDVIHFHYNPVPGERPLYMTAIGRGIED
mgnify:CR=1 FL=1|jgi:hypothetical protein